MTRTLVLDGSSPPRAARVAPAEDDGSRSSSSGRVALPETLHPTRRPLAHRDRGADATEHGQAMLRTG
jgi:hypothetical protein